MKSFGTNVRNDSQLPLLGGDREQFRLLEADPVENRHETTVLKIPLKDVSLVCL